jgi:predicted HicB family RNase H-like nuclease
MACDRASAARMYVGPRTEAEALESVHDAIAEWKNAAREMGRKIPEEGSSLGQWRQRVPRTMHQTLKRLAEAEGVSLNSFVPTVLAEAEHATPAAHKQVNRVWFHAPK